MRHLSRLVWAWAYILSSRWVEVLVRGGEEATVNQTEHVNEESFWEIVVDRPWLATINRSKGIYYAQWCI